MTKKEIIALINKEKIVDIEVQTSDNDGEVGVHFFLNLKSGKQVSFSQYVHQKIQLEPPYCETWEDGNSICLTPMTPKNFQ